MRKKIISEGKGKLPVAGTDGRKEASHTIKRKLTAEDSYFAERDKELIEKHKQEKKKKEDVPVKKIKICPDCGGELSEIVLKNVTVDQCKDCEGVWTQKKDLQLFLKKEASVMDNLMSALFPDKSGKKT